MFDARIFTNSLDNAKRILGEHQAVFKGEYEIHDIIFSSKNTEETLDKVFLRLRFVLLNIWDEKQVIVSIKNTERKEIGKQSIIPIKEQFDTEESARSFIQEKYSDTFEFDFEFDRRGWQYYLGEDCVDLEDIQGYYSIEFKSKTEDGLRKLLKMFGVELEEVIQGPSVVAIRNLLKDWYT